jgi:hypothetical protein
LETMKSLNLQVQLSGLLQVVVSIYLDTFVEQA